MMQGRNRRNVGAVISNGSRAGITGCKKAIMPAHLLSLRQA